LKVEGGGGNVNIEEGCIDVAVGGRAGRWLGVREKVFGIVGGMGGKVVVSGVAVGRCLESMNQK
jgi:hypothetical protein